jgi:hypothetical protein
MAVVPGNGMTVAVLLAVVVVAVVVAVVVVAGAMACSFVASVGRRG